MIGFTLSEKEFDYELQALATGFFPGKRTQINGESGDLHIAIDYGDAEISVCVETKAGRKSSSAAVTGDDDWHKKEGKLAHPYRTYYKNIVKKLVFTVLRDFPEEWLPEGFERRLPVWGTMTGVRPTKIPMNMLLEGRERTEVMEILQNVYCCSEQKAALGTEIAAREAALLQQNEYQDGYSLYVGIPFCPTTCLYCSFPSYPCDRFGHLRDDYVAALQREIKGTAKLMQGKRLTSVYMGGGTPTTLSPEQLRTVIKTMQEYFPMDTSVEFTVEAGRPDSITEDKLLALRECGVDRVSVNPQTMQQKTLDLIGRRHTVDQTIQAFELARKLGFTNINMDLIIGLPGEELSDFEDTLRQVKQLAPDSLTIHSLVIKRASRLRSVLEEQGALGETEQIRGRRMEQMLARGEQFAGEQGYLPYYMYRQKNSAGHAGSGGQENIGYAKPGSECLYNILIMEEMQSIVALGAGASTKKYHSDRGQVSRIENVKSVTDYIFRVDEMIERKRHALER